MAVYNFAFPVLPGREGEARKFAQDALGAHRQHYNSLMKASGTTRVTWSLQQTPAGSFMLVWFEAKDVQAIFELLGKGTGDDAAWMRGWIKNVGGVDMTQGPMDSQPEIILEWPA